MKKVNYIPLILLLTSCSDPVGKVSLGVFTTKDVIIEAKQDPIVKGVTCHISHIEANLDFSDPSDMSIACRQTGVITAAQLAQIDKSANGEVVFKQSKSILLKSLKVRRILDEKNKNMPILRGLAKRYIKSEEKEENHLEIYAALIVKSIELHREIKVRNGGPYPNTIYILDSLKNTNVKVSRLAQGLPVGGEIESLDDGTLFSAFKNRKSIESNSD